MALTVSLSLIISTDRQTLTISDNTVYTPRSDYYVYLNAYKVDAFYNKTQLTVTPNVLDPNLVTSWNVPYNQTQSDGWNQFLYIAPKLWSAVVTYNQYDAVFYNGNVYTSIAGGNLNHVPTAIGFWNVVADPATLASNKDQANESLNLDSLVYDRVLSYNGQYYFANKFQEMATGTDSNNQAVLATYDLFSLWLSAMTICDSRTQTIIGEQLARAIQSTYIDQPTVFSTSVV